MKQLMTVQPKNGEKLSVPMLIDTNESDMCSLADNILRVAHKVLNFQPVIEYKADPWPETGCKPDPCETCGDKD